MHASFIIMLLIGLRVYAFVRLRSVSVSTKSVNRYFVQVLSYASKDGDTVSKCYQGTEILMSGFARSVSEMGGRQRQK